MSGAAASRDRTETRHAMLRVWLTISAVWIAFWLLIAVLFATAEMRYQFADELDVFVAIMLAPPLLLLILGAIIRLLFEAFGSRLPAAPQRNHAARSARSIDRDKPALLEHFKPPRMHIEAKSVQRNRS